MKKILFLLGTLTLLGCSTHETILDDYGITTSREVKLKAESIVDTNTEYYAIGSEKVEGVGEIVAYKAAEAEAMKNLQKVLEKDAKKKLTDFTGELENYNQLEKLFAEGDLAKNASQAEVKNFKVREKWISEGRAHVVVTTDKKTFENRLDNIMLDKIDDTEAKLSRLRREIESKR